MSLELSPHSVSTSSRSRGNWTQEEDELLTSLVQEFGLKKWAVIAAKLPSGRIGKQCRERWVNHLDVYVKKVQWSPEEDAILIENQKKLGNKWCAISKLLDGRPENAVKNRWNSLVNRSKQQVSEQTLDAKKVRLSTPPLPMLPSSSLLDYKSSSELISAFQSLQDTMKELGSSGRGGSSQTNSAATSPTSSCCHSEELEALEGICALRGAFWS